MRSIVEYVRPDGSCPFRDWFDRLAPAVAAKVVTAKARLQNGIGDVQPVGQGVSEFRIHSGPGYRVYFGQDGERLVVLLVGGDKGSQPSDIARAKELWTEYRRRRKAETVTSQGAPPGRRR